MCLSVGDGGKLDKPLVVPFSSRDGINSSQPFLGLEDEAHQCCVPVPAELPSVTAGVTSLLCMDPVASGAPCPLNFRAVVMWVLLEWLLHRSRRKRDVGLCLMQYPWALAGWSGATLLTPQIFRFLCHLLSHPVPLVSWQPPRPVQREPTAQKKKCGGGEGTLATLSSRFVKTPLHLS